MDLLLGDLSRNGGAVQVWRLLGADGFFEAREDSAEAVTLELGRRIAVLEDRLEDREAALVRKFTALERALGQIQAQNSGFLSQLAQLGQQS